MPYSMADLIGRKLNNLDTRKRLNDVIEFTITQDREAGFKVFYNPFSLGIEVSKMIEGNSDSCPLYSAQPTDIIFADVAMRFHSHPIPISEGEKQNFMGLLLYFFGLGAGYIDCSRPDLQNLLSEYKSVKQEMEKMFADESIESLEKIAECLISPILIRIKPLARSSLLTMYQYNNIDSKTIDELHNAMEEKDSETIFKHDFIEWVKKGILMYTYTLYDPSRRKYKDLDRVIKTLGKSRVQLEPHQ